MRVGEECVRILSDRKKANYISMFGGFLSIHNMDPQPSVWFNGDSPEAQNLFIFWLSSLIVPFLIDIFFSNSGHLFFTKVP